MSNDPDTDALALAESVLALDRAATPGLWSPGSGPLPGSKTTDWCWTVFRNYPDDLDTDSDPVAWCCRSDADGDDDAELIARYRTAAPLLAEHVQRLVRRSDSLQRVGTRAVKLWREAAERAAKAEQERDMFAEQNLALNDGAVCYEQELLDRGADLDEVVERRGKALHARLVADDGAKEDSPYIVSVLAKLRAQVEAERARADRAIADSIRHAQETVALREKLEQRNDAIRALNEHIGWNMTNACTGEATCWCDAHQAWVRSS